VEYVGGDGLVGGENANLDFCMVCVMVGLVGFCFC